MHLQARVGSCSYASFLSRMAENIANYRMARKSNHWPLYLVGYLVKYLALLTKSGHWFEIMPQAVYAV